MAISLGKRVVARRSHRRPVAAVGVLLPYAAGLFLLLASAPLTLLVCAAVAGPLLYVYDAVAFVL